MPSVLTKKYRTFLAEQFLASIEANTVAPYVFISHPQEWMDEEDPEINDGNPPTPLVSVQAVDFDYWRDMLGAKRVIPDNTSLVVARRNWTTGTVYDQYDDTDEALFAGSFYVLDTSELPYKVYKCLWNADGEASTVAPSSIGTSVNPVATADGYVWQYLYTITADVEKFLTTAWMPVQPDANVVSNAETYAGRLPTAVPLIITDGGTGFNAAVVTATTITGDGSGAEVSTDGVTISAGSVTSVVLSLGGSGYTTVSNVTVAQANATSATCRAIIPPYPNHGYDPIEELGAAAVMLYVALDGDEDGKLTTTNNFRRNGLIINPLDANGNVASELVYRQTYNVTFSSNTGTLQPDDVLTNTTKNTAPTGVAVDILAGDSNNYIVRLTSVNVSGEDEPFSTGDVLECSDSGVEIIIDSVEEPELISYSGDVLFVNQRTPVTRATSQVEQIKLVFTLG